ncbi:dsDNA nuclease domain-containing protein [Pseudonocardia kujensis]|uniref:dsDNA nuclease domain-containing protein n=1 Tax=Pseudonocardia kujensis TaxID=1128675 RepID=UPI001E3857A5|nr:dsDNA nuclease domain-containing protein [Pseudonocardia kujensis]MCE0763377.1 dsDNA nuclease domain-containing protein [Pseudonocardia kujensis]
MQAHESSSLGSAGPLEALVKIESDQTGALTFERYLWQAKQAVRQWLSCISDAEAAEHVMCEHVEDIAVVYSNRVRFLQLKTRDKGSWSASAMCSSGLDSLVRSYNTICEAGLADISTYELWLEGPIASNAETVKFVRSCSEASLETRKKLTKLGVKKSHLDDFLKRLTIHPDQPPRAHIDAKIIYELGAIWPAMSQPELSNLYARLLNIATYAQSADMSIPLAHAIRDGQRTSSTQPGNSCEEIERRTLSREMLAAVTPPLAHVTTDDLIARISAGLGASLLELKLQASGATPETIESMKALRADMEIERQLLLASGDNEAHELDLLAKRLLVLAESTARRLSIASHANPSISSRPAEAIVAELQSRPTELAHVDRKSLFDKDDRLVLGFLAHLSDECRFGWRG